MLMQVSLLVSDEVDPINRGKYYYVFGLVVVYENSKHRKKFHVIVIDTLDPEPLTS